MDSLCIAKTFLILPLNKVLNEVYASNIDF